MPCMADCCRHCKGWCRSFTRTESFLSILEALLLIVLIAFLTFVVLHFIACSKKEIDESTYPDKDTTSPDDKGVVNPTTVPPGVKCTWKPNEPTKPLTRYYEETGDQTTQSTVVKPLKIPVATASASKLSIAEEVSAYLTDGEDADSFKQYVLALVKIRPPRDITFGCILTIVADYWVVTAASCIEAIEEVDSLDSFVIMEHYGETRHGTTHAVADVLIHPWFQGNNKTYDVVALKSEHSLVRGSKSAVEFSPLLDYFLMTIGESLTILGFGSYRNSEQYSGERGVRRVWSTLVSPRQCGAGSERWSPRHLLRPVSAPHRSCSDRLLCAGARAARGAPCNYCAGTPLFLRQRLLGVMSDNPQCGVTCEPVIFANIALLKPWLDAILEGDEDFLA